MPKWTQKCLDEIARLDTNGQIVDRTPRPPRPEEAPPDLDAYEDDFQSRVIALAEAGGWKAFHPRISIRSRAGYVDLTMARVKNGRGRVIMAELKARGGKPTDDQKEWAAVLGAIGGPVEYYLWRPEDWPAIVEALR